MPCQRIVTQLTKPRSFQTAFRHASHSHIKAYLGHICDKAVYPRHICDAGCLLRQGCNSDVEAMQGQQKVLGQGVAGMV